METTSKSPLTTAEQELVALGAALGSNCVPCIEHHIPAARAAGLEDRKIHAAVLLADRIRQVPARKVLAAAVSMLGDVAGGAPVAEQDSGCAQRQPQAAQEQPCCT